VAYELDGTPEQQQETLKYLEWREKQYDIRHYVDLHSHPVAVSEPLVPAIATVIGDASRQVPEDLRQRQQGGGESSCSGEQEGWKKGQSDGVLVRGCLVYIASTDTTRNVNHLGPVTLDALARQIATSAGPSGPNCDYLFGLTSYMREMGVVDEEMFRLEEMVRAVMAIDACSKT
jgi:cation transport regulator ChaC